MGLTNAQVALLAAAESPYGGVEALHSLASEHLSWLAAQDEAGTIEPHPNPLPAIMCGQLGRGGSICEKDRNHDGKHLNIKHGVSWDDNVRVIEKPARIVKRGTHFRPSHRAKHITCGELYDEDLHLTTEFVRDVTCTDCKEELGL